MPRVIQPLTDSQIKHAKPKAKPYKIFDGGGLYLEVMPSGAKLWRMKFQQTNKWQGKPFSFWPLS